MLAGRIWYFGVMDVREEKFVVRTYECGADGRVRIASLMQYLQEAAALHAEQLGFGVEKLGTLDGYWVLSNIRVEIARLPAWNEQVTVRTWPSGYSRLIATREFVGQGWDNGELFRAGSEWMVLDKQSPLGDALRRNRPKNLLHLDLGLPTTGTKVLQEKLSRLEPHNDYSGASPPHANLAGHVVVPGSSIDLNGHVNNTEYVRWGMDALSRAFKLRGNIRSVQATYLSEVFEGDELDLLVSCGPGESFHVVARKSGTQTNVFVMEVSC